MEDDYVFISGLNEKSVFSFPALVPWLRRNVKRSS
jgi:hypothetical protein